MEAGLPNFWEQEGSSGCPAAPLPFLKFAGGGPQGRRHQRGGLYGWPIWLSTPENDKTDKKRNAAFVTEKTQPRRGFFAPASGATNVGNAENFCKGGAGDSAVLDLKLAAIGFDHVRTASA